VHGVVAHPFLSEAWIAAARAIHDEFKDRVDEPTESVRLNVTVFDAPFSDGDVLGHIDTTSGSVVPGEGHLDDPDVSVRVPYSFARQLLVEQHYDMVMIAFMTGEIEVTGDVTRILSLQDIDATAEQQQLAEEVAARLRAITE
jgi:hypothetical protein